MALEDYNWADRFVHRVAFSTSAPQALLCDLETRQFGAEIEAQGITAPIFITSLPRAGTTLLLEVLFRHPSLVTNSYRDMPFVLSPIVWRRLSRRFQVNRAAKERSHGDGLFIDVDSPEAFEEVVWMKHFPEHYTKRGIALWDALPGHFIKAFSRHMKALIVSRDGKPRPSRRYLSKNNANIARLPLLLKAFPDARALVPLRDPFDHASSLLEQHKRALISQSESRFVRDYTRDIGHFEFGASHRPILFEGMDEILARFNPLQLDYWLHYWIAAHRHLLNHKVGEFIDMERFTRARATTLLCDRLNLPAAPDAMIDAEAMIRPIRRYQPRTTSDSALLMEADELYRGIRESNACIV